MATPYISGVAALYLEKHKKDKQKIKQFHYHLLNTAEPMYESSKGTGEFMTVIRQGAGVVRPHRLLEVEDYISPHKLELARLKDQKPVQEQHITIHNKGKIAKTYLLRHAPAVAINLQDVFSPKKEPGAHAKVTFRREQVTVPPMGSLPVTLTIDSGALFHKKSLFFSGFIEVVEKATKEILRVPYMGVSGDKSQLTILKKPKLFHMRNSSSVGTFTDDTSRKSTELKPAFETSLSEEDNIMVDYNLPLYTLYFIHCSRQSV
jgi:hypothetical protein